MNGVGEGPGTPARVVGIGSVVALMVGVILTLRPYLLPEPAPPLHPPPVQADREVRPIPAEADVFRTRPEDLAPPPDSPRRQDAHPRTLAMWRTTREYPGAPPRVPHGLRSDEYRESACNSCHERGGWVPRFASYAPVAPHPEYQNCLQCHVPEDALVGRPFPDTGEDALCRQCHAPTQETPPFRPVDWRTTAWPALPEPPLDGAPPPIPHDLQLRTNCVTCHVAPGGVAEIRTDHPERANCRQCHVSGTGTADGGPAEFQRPDASGSSGEGGPP